MRYILIILSFLTVLLGSRTNFLLVVEDFDGYFSNKPSLDVGFSSLHIKPEKLNKDELYENTVDTVVALQSNFAKMSDKQRVLLVDFVKNGGKLVIVNDGGDIKYNKFKWLPFGYTFFTNSANLDKEKEGISGVKISEYNYFTKYLDIDDINKNTNGFFYSNVIISKGDNWNSAIVATNSNQISGDVLSYAKYEKGIFIYFGINIQDINSNDSLLGLYKSVLLLPWNPDPLPYTNASAREILPPLVKISGISHNSVKLTWKSPFWLKGIDGYKVYRSEDNGSTKILLSDTTQNSYEDKSAEDNKTFLYYVVSYSKDDNSLFSNPVSATPPNIIYGKKVNLTKTTSVTIEDNFEHILGDASNSNQKVSGDPVSLATGSFI